MILVSFDYKNIEGLVSSVLANETWAIEAAKLGRDLHQELADKLNCSRAKAKIINHGANYGMSPFGIAKQLGVSVDEAKLILSDYWKVKSSVKSYKARVIKRAKEVGYIGTIYGFRRDLSTLDAKRSIDDQIWSTYIQGSAADLMKKCILDCYDYLQENNAGRILTTMHDSIVFSLVDESHVDKLREVAESVDSKFPLKVDVQIGSF